jgi:flagellar biosynthesis protein FlhG
LDKLISDQAEGLRRMLARSGSRVIAVTSGSAGVGSTTTVVNLAAALAQQGKDVLVIDECLGEKSVSAMLGGVRGAGNFAAVMRGEMTLDDAASASRCWPPRVLTGKAIRLRSSAWCCGAPPMSC